MKSAQQFSFPAIRQLKRLTGRGHVLGPRTATDCVPILLPDLGFDIVDLAHLGGHELEDLADLVLIEGVVVQDRLNNSGDLVSSLREISREEIVIQLLVGLSLQPRWRQPVRAQVPELSSQALKGGTTP